MELSEEDPLPDPSEPIYCLGGDGQRRQIIADVPPMGYAWLSAAGSHLPANQPSRPLAEDNILRNEYMEIRVNKSTAGLQARRFKPARPLATRSLGSLLTVRYNLRERAPGS